MEQLNRAEYTVAVKAIKEAIQISRYRAAKLVNKEVLALYYAVGRYISLNSRHASYGSSALRVISNQLQQEMPGLKGFSESSLKRMRKFYEDWSELIENRPPVADDFSFMGNQYRLIVDGEESFIDLLFFNRRLRSLVAVELKSGKFKPEYAGKMNYYLSALDEYVKMPDENPSIGIILCRSMNEKKVEFSFRDMTKPMGGLLHIIVAANYRKHIKTFCHRQRN